MVYHNPLNLRGRGEVCLGVHVQPTIRSSMMAPVSHSSSEVAPVSHSSSPASAHGVDLCTLTPTWRQRCPQARAAWCTQCLPGVPRPLQWPQAPGADPTTEFFQPGQAPVLSATPPQPLCVCVCRLCCPPQRPQAPGADHDPGPAGRACEGPAGAHTQALRGVPQGCRWAGQQL